jgi:hypothetical protein
LEEWSVREAREEVHTNVDRQTWQMMVCADALALAWEPGKWDVRRERACECMREHV